MRFLLGFMMFAVGWALSGGAVAEKVAAERPELLRKLMDCKAVEESSLRLACYDAQVGAIDAAERNRDLVVLDRAQMRETRRSLFGFPLPNIGIFGHRGEQEIAAEDISQIDSTVVSARPLASGAWSIRLADDSGTWETTNPLDASPVPGDKVRIKKAALGSYLGRVGYSRGVRFRRVG